MQSLIAFISNPDNNFLGHTLSYLELCGLSILIAMLIGILLGIVVARNAVLAFVAVNLSGMLRAIPIIVFLIAALPVLGTGFTPALLALIILGIPPILLNTYTGIRGIDPAVIDAARGMGMTGGQIIGRIQLPLVLPIVAAGIRTAAVQIVATATLAAIIGAGGYGEYILYGVNQFNTTAILAGALPVTVLALLIEVLMGQLQHYLTPVGLRIQDQPVVSRA
ncbi:MAG TPA: ABC transporter permease [Ktedonobacteraceae bacterium]|jgi:osmoprotectant transport system permease protein